jgi:hypothetical protein
MQTNASALLQRVMQQGWTAIGAASALLVLIAFSMTSAAADIYYYPKPELGSPETDDTVAILHLLNEIGLTPKMFKAEGEVPEKEWCLAVTVVSERNESRPVRYLIEIYQKGGVIKLALDKVLPQLCTELRVTSPSSPTTHRRSHPCRPAGRRHHN